MLRKGKVEPGIDSSFLCQSLWCVSNLTHQMSRMWKHQNVLAYAKTPYFRFCTWRRQENNIEETWITLLKKCSHDQLTIPSKKELNRKLNRIGEFYSEVASKRKDSWRISTQENQCKSQFLQRKVIKLWLNHHWLNQFKTQNKRLKKYKKNNKTLLKTSTISMLKIQNGDPK